VRALDGPAFCSKKMAQVGRDVLVSPATTHDCSCKNRVCRCKCRRNCEGRFEREGWDQSVDDACNDDVRRQVLGGLGGNANLR